MPANSEVVAIREKVSKILVPQNISEQSKINGHIFTPKVLKLAKLAKMKVPKEIAEGTKAFQFAHFGEQFASDSAGGGPTIGENSIKIWINGSNANAGSKADYIWMRFGGSKKIKLWGYNKTEFPKGWWLSWDLNSVGSFLESIPTNDWDDIWLETDSTDGILIDRVVIKHSSVTILDWSCGVWLDGSKLEQYGKIGFEAKILAKKLGQVSNSWIPQIHWAARELGKSNGKKYGTSGAWCSEFTSWCFQQAHWSGMPTGSIGSSKMEQYFSDRGRKYSKTQILNKTYKMIEGDYIRFQWSNGGQHSALFMSYVDDGDSPTNDTRFKTIEGNTSSTVAVRTRTLKDVLSVGNTR